MSVVRARVGVLMCVATLMGVPSVRAQSASASSASAPSLVPLDASGVPRVIAQHKGNVILVDMWASWCGPCRDELPGLISLERELRGHGLRLITLSADDSAQWHYAAAVIDSLGAPTPRYVKQAASDAAFINAIDSTWSGALPALFLYDRSGRRVGSYVGETSAETIRKAVVPLLAAERPAAKRID